MDETLESELEMLPLFDVVRKFADGKDRVLYRGVPRYVAKRMCDRSEANSDTCMQPVAIARTQRRGAWRDVYVESSVKYPLNKAFGLA